jgi:HlyD family type I secretion membrane fusion protein
MSNDDSELLALRRKLVASTNHRKPILIGVSVFALFAGVFGVGAGTAPIEGAAIATGNFVARGQNQIIQHLEGGLVAEILVKEGDAVKQADILVRLDTTPAKADLARLTTELHMGWAREARLVAEREGQGTISYPEALLQAARKDPAIAALMRDQDREFAARLASREIKIAILRQQIRAGEEQIIGFEAQRSANAKQRALLQQETDSVQSLFDKGLTAAEKLYRLKRGIADLEGQDGKTASDIGAVRQTNLENEQQIASLEKERVEEAAKDVISLRLELAKVQKELVQTSDLLRRSVVIAPVDGIVVKLDVNTIGGVIQQGGSVVELLPTPADLVIEARITPGDIDRISQGQKASVRIPALHIPYSPLMNAKVEYVSADRRIDPEKKIDYYVARISAVELPGDVDRLRIYPGMQVEVFILTGSRTFAEYLLDPIWESFTRSIREN